MNTKTFFLTLFLQLIILSIFAQSFDEEFSFKKMEKDLAVFKQIRLAANSGLYKYRTKAEIDSTYRWADQQIKTAKTYGDFYNIICQLTDYEGSSHNSTKVSNKIKKSLKAEAKGYFPLPIKLIEDKVLINIKDGKIPLGAELLEINGEKLENILPNLYKYYSTDGVNISGKVMAINPIFGRYYRMHYGQKDEFEIKYKTQNSNQVQQITLTSISYQLSNKKFHQRYSKEFDNGDYKDWKVEEMYCYENINSTTSILTINSFAIGGNEDAPEHKTYVRFLDSIFIKIKTQKIENLIVDVRFNGGGTDPNDLVTYSYLTDRNFSENKEAWVSFQKIPLIKYVYTKVPVFLRPLGVIKYNKYFKKEFPLNKEGRFYQTDSSEDHLVRKPNKNAFHGNVYLLISPSVASAGSLFAAMLAGNNNTITIGEETLGGYYGHNGHTPLGYILPKSKINTFFSCVNLKQDVPKKENQIHNRGILPDYKVTQSYNDFINHTDTQMNFVLDLIEKKK